ncbi:discoidin domain-containing protein [Cohnella rhizosphaerae]
MKPRVPASAEQDRFLIGAFWPPVWSFTNDEQYAAMKEANIDYVQNVLGSELDSEPQNLKMLDLAAAHGLKVYVADPRVNGSDLDIETMVQTYMDHPATGGYYIKDEPGIGGLPDAAARYAKILAVDPDKVPYVNLLPEQAVANYEQDYVRSWIKQAGAGKLKYLSFDHYPLLAAGGFSAGYFNNLDIIRRAGLEADVKTSSYLQSVGIPGGLRRPNEAEMDYVAYANLAYGIKNVVWFTYWTPTNRGEPFTNAVIDPQGNKTDLYEPFKAMNARMTQLGKTLIHLDATQVYHTGASLPAGTAPVPSDFIAQPANASDESIVTYFTHRETGKHYLMIVNKAYKDASAKTLSFKLDGISGVSEVSAETGEPVAADYDAATGLLSGAFAPGEGRLYAIEDDGYEYVGPQQPVTAPADAPPLSPIGNIAFKKSVQASSDYLAYGWNKNLLVDGIKIGINSDNGDKGWTSVPSNTPPAAPEWIRIDLAGEHQVNRVKLWPRNDQNTHVGEAFPLDFRVLVSKDDANWTEVAARTATPKPTDGAPLVIDIDSVPARYVKIEFTQLRKEGVYLVQLAEVEIFADPPASLLELALTPKALSVGGKRPPVGARVAKRSGAGSRGIG